MTEPTKGEVAELVNMLTGIAYWKRHGKPGERDPSPFDIRQADRLTRAAELLERHAAPVPVPVPPPELVRQWDSEAVDAEMPEQLYIATQAARWGDDQRLMACCELVKCSGYPVLALQMLAAMRPKPPSLAEQAVQELDDAGMRGDCIRHRTGEHR